MDHHWHHIYYHHWCYGPSLTPCPLLQCVPQSRVCDGQKDCYNGEDEELCSNKIQRNYSSPDPPAIVQLNSRGEFTLHALNNSLLSAFSPANCPPNHFQCPGQWTSLCCVGFSLRHRIIETAYLSTLTEGTLEATAWSDVPWTFTPKFQPRVNNLIFYAQSPITDTSGRTALMILIMTTIIIHTFSIALFSA